MCTQILDGLKMEGMTEEVARGKFVVLSEKGVLGAADGKYGSPHHTLGASGDMLKWANPTFSDGEKLLEAIKQFKPTVLLGLSTKGGLFNEQVVKTMHEHW